MCDPWATACTTATETNRGSLSARSKNEYPELGGSFEVVHHTQLLNRLVREGRLTPVAPPSENGAGAGTAVTDHDPCFAAGTTASTTLPGS